MKKMNDAGSSLTEVKDESLTSESKEEQVIDQDLLQIRKRLEEKEIELDVERDFHEEVKRRLISGQPISPLYEIYSKYLPNKTMPRITSALILGAIQWGKVNPSIFDPLYFKRVLWDERFEKDRKERPDLWDLCEVMKGVSTPAGGKKSTCTT